VCLLNGLDTYFEFNPQEPVMNSKLDFNRVRGEIKENYYVLAVSSLFVIGLERCFQRENA
jgi:hypothetical protein